VPCEAPWREWISYGTYDGHVVILAVQGTEAPGSSDIVTALIRLLAGTRKQ